MKSTGIVRKVDELGRIVLPIELRRTLDIAERMLLRSLLRVITSSCTNIILPASSAKAPRTSSATRARMSAPHASRRSRRSFDLQKRKEKTAGFIISRRFYFKLMADLFPLSGVKALFGKASRPRKQNTSVLI